MGVHVRKSILLFLVLFATWQLLYPLGLNTLLGYAIVLAVVASFLVLDRQSFAQVGLRKPSRWKSYIGIGSMISVVSATYMFLLGSGLYSNVPPYLSRPLILSVGFGILGVPYVLVLALTIGIVEETSFRGYILRNLRESFSAGRAVLYSSVLFGLYHISFFHIYTSPLSAARTLTYWGSFVLEAFLTGVFLGYFYLNTEQTVIGTITFHSSNIFIQTFVPYSLAFSTAEGHLLVGTIPVISLILLWILLKRTHRARKAKCHRSLTPSTTPRG